MIEGVYTTSEVASILSIAPATAAKAIDRGDIKGWTLPMSRDRRVERTSMARYLATKPNYLELLTSGAIRPRKIDREELAELLKLATEATCSQSR